MTQKNLNIWLQSELNSVFSEQSLATVSLVISIVSLWVVFFLPHFRLVSWNNLSRLLMLNEVRNAALKDAALYLSEDSTLNCFLEKQGYIPCQCRKMSHFPIGNRWLINECKHLYLCCCCCFFLQFRYWSSGCSKCIAEGSVNASQEDRASSDFV